MVTMALTMLHFDVSWTECFIFFFSRFSKCRCDSRGWRILPTSLASNNVGPGISPRKNDWALQGHPSRSSHNLGDSRSSFAYWRELLIGLKPHWKIWKSIGWWHSQFVWKNKKCSKPPTSNVWSASRRGKIKAHQSQLLRLTSSRIDFAWRF